MARGPAAGEGGAGSHPNPGLGETDVLGGGLERGSVWMENGQKTQSFSSSSDWLIGLFFFKTLSVYEEHLCVSIWDSADEWREFQGPLHGSVPLNTCTFRPRTVLSPVCLLPAAPGWRVPWAAGRRGCPHRSIKPRNTTADHCGNCPCAQLTGHYSRPTATPCSRHTVGPFIDETEVRG